MHLAAFIIRIMTTHGHLNVKKVVVKFHLYVNLGNRWGRMVNLKLRSLYSHRNNADAHRLGGQLRPRAGLGSVKNLKISFPAENPTGVPQSFSQQLSHLAD